MLKETKSGDWKNSDIKKVLKSLKNNKARDPLGFINELFKEDAAGPDAVNAIRLLMNRLKEDTAVGVPLLSLANISTIYKNKGSRMDLENDRGIFNLGVFRYILEKLIFTDKQPAIEEGMSDSNVGGRKGRNIRNHLFIVYGVINNVINGGAEPVDIGVYDLRSCSTRINMDNRRLYFVENIFIGSSIF